MVAAAPVVGPTPSRVGFELKGRDYSPDEPCLFNDACVRADAFNWWKHAGQWIDALSARASTAEQRERVARLAKKHEEVNQRDCTDNCGSAVQAFISMARLSQALAEQWGEPVTEVSNDWGWVLPIALPIPDWFDQLKAGLRRKAMAKLVPLAILALLLLSTKKRRGGSLIG